MLPFPDRDDKIRRAADGGKVHKAVLQTVFRQAVLAYRFPQHGGAAGVQDLSRFKIRGKAAGAPGGIQRQHPVFPLTEYGAVHVLRKQGQDQRAVHVPRLGSRDLDPDQLTLQAGLRIVGRRMDDSRNAVQQLPELKALVLRAVAQSKADIIPAAGDLVPVRVKQHDIVDVQAIAVFLQLFRRGKLRVIGDQGRHFSPIIEIPGFFLLGNAHKLMPVLLLHLAGEKAQRVPSVTQLHIELADGFDQDGRPEHQHRAQDPEADHPLSHGFRRIVRGLLRRQLMPGRIVLDRDDIDRNGDEDDHHQDHHQDRARGVLLPDRDLGNDLHDVAGLTPDGAVFKL